MPLASLLHRWRWRLFAGVFGASLFACTTLFVWPIASGRTDPPYYASILARSALDGARRARADRWAPASLIAAESSLRSALLEYRVQEVRLLPFRDFRAARAALDDATSKSQTALADANRARLDAKGKADDALEAADRETARSGSVAEAIQLGPYTRALLQKSRMALFEARAMYARGDYLRAASRARESSAQAQIVSREAVDAASRYADASLVSRWRRMISETVSWSRSTGGTAIVVLKENHRLELYDNGQVVRSYPADMGYRSVNAKLRSGDAATPEGRYLIVAKKAASTYYKALALNYPNDDDRAQFERLKRRGEIPRWASPGGLIEIHGDGGRGKDWTKGCIALANGDIDDLYRRVGVGTPVTIVGGNGSGTFARLARSNGSASSRTE